MDKEELIALLKEKLSITVSLENGSYMWGEPAKTIRARVILSLDGETISEDSDSVSVD